MDHRTSIRNQGGYRVDNLFMACTACNKAKGRSSEDAWRAELAARGIPRPSFIADVETRLKPIVALLDEVEGKMQRLIDAAPLPNAEDKGGTRREQAASSRVRSQG